MAPDLIGILKIDKNGNWVRSLTLAWRVSDYIFNLGVRLSNKMISFVINQYKKVKFDYNKNTLLPPS